MKGLGRGVTLTQPCPMSHALSLCLLSCAAAALVPAVGAGAVGEARAAGGSEPSGAAGPPVQWAEAR